MRIDRAAQHLEHEFSESTDGLSRRHVRLAGNTLSEYALIGGLGLLICLGGLMLLGNSLDSALQGLLSLMRQQTQATNANGQQLTAKSSFTVPPVTSSPAVVLPSSPASIQISAQGTVIQSMGSNGSTETLAQSILDSAQQALASGAITQDQYDIIVRVSNAGHAIASIQGLLEQAYQQSKGDANAYANTLLQYNGQTYTPAELNTLLRDSTDYFSTLKTEASTQVANNQNLLGTLNNAGAQIINNGYATQQQNASAASFLQYQDSSTTSGSVNTNQQSANICTAGQHMDVNNQCVN